MTRYYKADTWKERERDRFYRKSGREKDIFKNILSVVDFEASYKSFKQSELENLFLNKIWECNLCLKEDEGVSEITVSGSKVFSKERFIKIIFNQQKYHISEISEIFCFRVSRFKNIYFVTYLYCSIFKKLKGRKTGRGSLLHARIRLI